MILQAHQLSCIQGDRILFEALDFSVRGGELLLIEGQNGCGKTTLLKTLATVRQIDDGQILWQDKSIAKLGDDYRDKLTWLGHLNGIKLDLTAYENLRIACVLNGLSVSDLAIMEALEKIGLYDYEDLPVRVLSQGQKRRTALAYLLLSQTPIWILDEPFVALDVKAVKLLQSVISKHVEQGGIVILTTHQEVGLNADRVQRLQLTR